MNSNISAALIGAGVAAVGGILFYAISFGEIKSDVSNLNKRLEKLEASAGSQLRNPTKEDICLRLLDILDKNLNQGGHLSERLELQSKFREFGCLNNAEPSVENAQGSPRDGIK